MTRHLQAGSFVAGGLLIGVWPAIAFLQPFVLRYIDLGAWSFWGLVGLVIAAGFYAARTTHELVRIGIWIALGIALAFLGVAALFNQQGEAIAAVFTFLGGGLIATALPLGPTNAAPEPEPDPYEAPAPQPVQQAWDEPERPMVRARSRSK